MRRTSSYEYWSVVADDDGVVPADAQEALKDANDPGAPERRVHPDG